MATEKQIQANRLNALKSTGPRTEKGRAAVRFNALRHGFDADSLLLPGENRAAFRRLRRSFYDQYKPATPAEGILVTQLLTSAWTVFRAHRWETGFFELTAPDDHRECQRILSRKEVPPRAINALAIRRDSMRGNCLDKVGRTLARAERSFYHALHELERLQAARAGQSVPLPQALDVVINSPEASFSDQSHFSGAPPIDITPTDTTT